MATAVTTNRVAANLAVKVYKHNPDTTAATVVSIDAGTTKNYVPMLNYSNFWLGVMNHLCTSASGPTLIEIVAATDSSGTNITVILASSTLACVTQGDFAQIEVSAEQIEEVGRAAGFAFTHVTGRITTSNSGDEQGVCFIRYGAKSAASGLTANSIT